MYAESGHMPRWAAAEPASYWAAADAHERANGRLFKGVEVALPLALSEDARRELAVGFAHHLTDREHLPYTLALHAGQGTNPHAHLLISERGNDGIERSAELWFRRYNAAEPELGGAQKSEALKPKAWLEETRAAWAELTNQALERAGHEVRIDHRSLEAQGIERAPGLHFGPAVIEMEARGIETDRGDEALAIAREAGEIRRGYAALDAEEAELERELLQERTAEGLFQMFDAESGGQAAPEIEEEPPAARPRTTPAQEAGQDAESAQAVQERQGPSALETARAAGELARHVPNLTVFDDKGAYLSLVADMAGSAWEQAADESQGPELERDRAREIVDKIERVMRAAIPEIEDPREREQAELARERLLKAEVEEYRAERQAEQEQERRRERERDRGAELELEP